MKRPHGPQGPPPHDPPALPASPAPRPDPLLESAARAAALRAAMLDALPAPVCLLDREGVVVAGNAPWRRLTRASAPWGGVGIPYLQALEAEAGDSTPEALEVVRGALRHRLAGIDTPSAPHVVVVLGQGEERRPFQLLLTPAGPEGDGGLLATHLEVTASPSPPHPAPAPLSRRPPPTPGPDRPLTPVGPEELLGELEALRRSEARFRAIFEGVDHGLLVLEPDGTVRGANRRAAFLLGIHPDALPGRTLASLAREAPGVVDRAWEAVNREGRAQGVHRFPGPDGRERFLCWWARAGVVEGRHLLVLRPPEPGLPREDPLRQARKLEALGQVTGGIAHEINNVLTVILAAVDLLMEEHPPDSGAREELERIRDAARRGGETVRRLLTFSRKHGGARRTVDLGEVVRSMEDLLDRVLPPSISLRIDVQDPAPLAVVGPGDVEEMILNLASNARDAMPEGGILEIRLRRVRLGAREAEPLGLRGPGEYLALTVRDSGTGMDARTLERALEPFFTTRGVEGGSGLGLPLVYGLIREYGGSLGIRSAPGAGTSVTLWFPAVGVPRPVRDTPGQVEPMGGRETILLVEDDPDIQATAARILERFGYRVIRASDGEEAMEILNRDGHRVNLVLSDVVMPRAGGVAVHQAARMLLEPPPFLFMSGYAASELTGTQQLPEGVPLLPKPWTASQLLRAVRSTLDARGEGRNGDRTLDPGG